MHETLTLRRLKCISMADGSPKSLRKTCPLATMNSLSLTGSTSPCLHVNCSVKGNGIWSSRNCQGELEMRPNRRFPTGVSYSVGYVSWWDPRISPGGSSVPKASAWVTRISRISFLPTAGGSLNTKPPLTYEYECISYSIDSIPEKLRS